MNKDTFPKVAKKEAAKAPKEPKRPKSPIEPKAPEKYIFDNRQSLAIHDYGSKTVNIPFSKIMDLRSQINADDDCINIIINSASSYCGGGDYESEIEYVYFEWYEKTEDPKYTKRLEEYQEKLKKYHIDKNKYESNLEQYNKDLKEYKKQLKVYQLEEMRALKSRLEEQIAKAEKKAK
jgi:hypothetical protein